MRIRPHRGEGKLGCLSTLGGIVIIALLLFISNPKEDVVQKQMVSDGWFPTKVDRTNLGVMSFTTVTGFTGAQGTYIGVAGQVFQLGGSSK